ncbi:hypothetical protein [Sediminicurvatus halobius]|uniref:Uncharacterized protein n=1 Tax=Sediminicurvatus halobius TaxID=2182432 RepID=A0A2U2MYH3_9GAMM|nr:hypothetical protein [Spiribacter halobius]PWG61779.1 hypothetical protein DEM34_15040 [Spiribacter halobius]UEX76786.1 hypothetical protein LMH63_12560 [Spiribacter halobius]
MALTFDFFGDAQLNGVLAELPSVHAVDASNPQDHVVYFGSPDDTRKVLADSNPGVDDIVVSIVDAAVGSGQEAGNVRLALTQADLSTATPGASLALGAQVLGGAANAVEIWARIDPETTAVSQSTELKLQCNTLRERQV